MELAIREKAKLQELEMVIEQGLKNFYEVGSALLEIREAELYRERHKTFEEYCKDRWDCGQWYVYKLVASAETVKHLDNCPIKPSNEGQVRPLAKIKDPELQREAWEIAVETVEDRHQVGISRRRAWGRYGAS